MKGNYQSIVIPLLVVVAAALILFFFRGHAPALFDPQGTIAAQQRDLIFFTLTLLLLVAIPTVLLAYFFAWRYRAKGNGKDAIVKATRSEELGKTPEHETLKELGIWLIPVTVIAILSPVLWQGAHKLDPYRPIDMNATAGENSAISANANPPLTIQVVSMDWKWFFIYPEQNIATVNFLEIPAGTPINFRLTAANAPMSSFWIPQLGSQIYSMSGMETQLHLVADTPGEFIGKNTEINGDGYSTMNFVTKAVSPSDFNAWIASIQQTSPQLTQALYDALKMPTSNLPSSTYSAVSANLFNKILRKYMGTGSGKSGTMSGMMYDNHL